MIQLKGAITANIYFQRNYWSRSFSYLNQINLTKAKLIVENDRNKSTQMLLIHRRSFSINECVVNFWKSVSYSTPVAYVQDGLIKIHDFTGLPWWATIILSTFLFRTTITLPLTIYQNIIMARIEKVALEMPAIVSELKKETAFAIKKYQWTEQQAKFIYKASLKKQWNSLIVRDNCHPAKTFIVLWAQIPLWICQSIALRNLASMQPDPSKLEAQVAYIEMTIGGFGWIPNLIEVDNSLIFPVTLGLLNLSIVQLQTIVRKRPSTKWQQYATNFFRILAIGMVPISANVPSCLCFYWVISSLYGLTQNFILLSPNIRRFVGIPKTQSEISNPYQRIVTYLKTGKSNEIVCSKYEPPQKP